MVESLQTYWYLYVILAVLIIVTFFVGSKAAKAAKKRNDFMKRYYDDMRRFEKLAKKYEAVSRIEAENSDPKELCEGLTYVLQTELDKSVSPEECFADSVQWRKDVYALFYFYEDASKDSLSFFFRNNAEPLPKIAISGLKTIGLDNIYYLAAAMYSMYDEKNESVSLDMERVSSLDEKFKLEFNASEFFSLIKNYITSNV